MSGDAWTAAGAIPASGDSSSSASTAQPAKNDPWMAAGAIPASAGQMPQQAQTPPDAELAMAPSQTAQSGMTPQRFGRDFGMGVRGVMTGAGGLADVVAAPLNAAINAATGARLSTSPVRDLANAGANAMGLASPQSNSEKLANAVVEGGTQGLATAGVAGLASGAEGVTGGVARTLASRPLVDAALSAESGGASETVRQHGGGPVAQIAAGLAAPVATHLAISAPSVAAEAVRNASAPFAAGMSPAAAQSAAGRVLTQAATDPAAARAALEKPSELVPGSQPTTYQQSGDPGLGALERRVFTKDNTPFQERAQAQNAARVQALGAIQQGADPNDLAASLRQHFADLDAAHEAEVAAATKTAQDKAAAISPEEPPEVTGSQLRSSISQALAAREGQDSALWKAVGDPVTNVAPVSAAARDIQSEIRPTAKPMTGDEADVFQAAQNMPTLSPFQDLVSLRSRVNDAMASARMAGEGQALRRLTMLRGAIQDHLADTVALQAAADDSAVQRGTMAPQDALLSKLQDQRTDFYARKIQAGGAVAEASGRNAFGGSRAVSGAAGAEVSPVGGPGNPAGAAGVSGNPSQPTIDEATAQRLAAATASTRATKQTFGAEPFKSVLATNGFKDDFRLPNGGVAPMFFRAGPKGYDHMQALLKATPEALPTIQRYAETTLRRAAMNPDGTLDPAKYAQWQKSYTDALRALPSDLKAKFSDAASATQALADARAARTAALKAAQSGAIGKVMGLSEPEDIAQVVGTIMKGGTGVADMKQLALATKGNPEARAGLRQAVADYMAKKVLGNASGDDQLKGAAFQTFLRNSRAPLNLIFTPEEVKSLEAIAADIQRSNLSLTNKPSGTPGTAHDIFGLIKSGATKGGHSFSDTMLALMAEHHGGLPSAIATVALKSIYQTLHGAGIARIDQLVSRAMLDPRLAAELLKKAPAKVTPMSLRPIAAALVKASIPASAATQGR